VDPDNGYLYVADVGRGQVVVFDDQRRYVTAIADSVSTKPTDVFVAEDRVWVADLGSRTVRVYEKDTYELLRYFPEFTPNSQSRLFSPTNLYVRRGKVYVSDFGDFKIKVFNTEGAFVSSIGSYGRTVGQFVRPKGVAVDEQDNVFVVDAGFENVQVFDPQGRLLMFFGGTYRGPGDMWLPAKVVVDYGSVEYFREYVHDDFELKYVLYVTNQFGPDKVSVYGFVEARARTVAEARRETLEAGQADDAEEPRPDQPEELPEAVDEAMVVERDVGVRTEKEDIDAEPADAEAEESPAPADSIFADTDARGLPEVVDRADDAVEDDPDVAPAGDDPADAVEEDPSLGRPPIWTPGAIDRGQGGWTVVVASEPTEAEGRATAEIIAAQFPDAKVDILPALAGNEIRYRVGIGQYTTAGKAKRELNRLAGQLPPGSWVVKIANDE
jgi:hypothetical protein